MRIVYERRSKAIEKKQNLVARFYEIEKEKSLLLKAALNQSFLDESKIYYASSKIQALVKGFLARRFAAQLIEESRSAVMLQKLVRGKFGRNAWMKEHWKKISVVKSPHALKLIIARSILIRQDKAVARGKVGSGSWIEYYDPETDSFWYYNVKTEQNTWICPLSLQKDLICTWEGYHQFGAPERLGRCRCIFSTTVEYQGHLKRAHTWHCEACGHKNNGLVFPKCAVCENTLSADGQNPAKILKDAHSRTQLMLSTFLLRQGDAARNADYNLKNSITQLVVEKRQTDIAEAAKDAAEKLITFESDFGTSKWLGSSKQSHVTRDNGDDDDDSASTMSTESSYSKLSLAMSASLDPNSSFTGYSKTFIERNRCSISSMSTTSQLTVGSGLLWGHITSSKAKSKAMTLTSTLNLPRIATASAGNRESPRKLDLQSQKEVEQRFERTVKKNSVPTIPQHGQIELVGPPVLPEEERGEILKGFIKAVDFDAVLGDDREAENQEDVIKFDEEDEDESDEVKALNAALPLKSWVWDAEGIGEKIQVCGKFTLKRCSKTTCPLAHPGIRDSAVVYHASFIVFDNGFDDRLVLMGKTYKIPYVLVCPWPHGECPKKQRCDRYHIYIRPSTIDIIKKFYPIENGIKTKTYASGSKMVGKVRGVKFTGYGAFHWPVGSTYVGDWVEDRRHGLGIYRTQVGAEYVGQFQHGLRHGWGVLYHPNGEEYVGQWENGKMHGVGRLSSKNGDAYEGEFVNHRYEGIGCFQKKNGDRYLGYVKEGYANGLGILALSTGEKYKGYFDRDVRHGSGACAYPNGSRYAGQWYRGLCDGFGVFVSSRGEKYVGQWMSGKKHGTGRYIFENGDFYDGEFRFDKAHGMGVYYHTLEGNIYNGEWEHDKRCGRGTYVFCNGSKYTGQWKDNNIHGKGKFDFANGSFYRGSFQNNLKHGKGVFTWPNNNCYKGNFVDDKMCGAGEMQYFAGHRYIGNWKNNAKNGFGKFYYVDGHVYEGDWINDERSGNGKMIFLIGSTIEEEYDGEWLHEQRHGYGVYKYRKDKGMVYEGYWENGLRHGEGKLSYKDGSYYRGQFVKEQMCGHGVFVGADGTQYDGLWLANKRHGMGVQLETDGSIYQGEFMDDMKHGNGRIQRPEGGAYIGVWHCDAIVGTGKFVLNCGEVPRGGPSQVLVKVFGF